MEQAFLSADHTPTAFALGGAHGRLGPWILDSHAVAMSCLEEAISAGDRTDFYGFEQNVVAIVAGHTFPLNASLLVDGI